MSALTGTGALVRLGLRLGRVRLVVWVLLVALVTVSTASAFRELYPTAASRELFATGVAANPTLRAMLGPGFDLTTIGGLTAWRIGTVAAVLVAVLNIFTVVRHTRAEEEAGRLELLGSTVVGRYAPLTAALTVALIADVAIAAFVAAGLIGLGLPAGGSIALGLSLGGAGAMFAAVAGVCAQLTASARAANTMSAMVLGVAFLLRAIGDSAEEGGPTWLSWLSPIGWMQRSRPFADERWWVFGLALAFAVVLWAVSYALAGRRDLGAGLLPQRPGPAHASPALGSALGLAWRLQRGSLAGWAAGFAVLGLSFGGIAQGVADLLGGNPQLEAMLSRMGGEQAIVDAYLAATMSILGILTSAYAVQATLRLRAEEVILRAEPILATRVGRTAWAMSHVTHAIAGTAVLLAVAGLTAGLAHGLRTGDVAGEVPRLLGATLVQVPAAWILAGLAAALFGLAPRFTVATWAAVVAFLLLEYLGPVLQVDQWVMDVSPFTHVPTLPGGELTTPPLLALTATAAALLAAGLAGFRRRDVG